MANGITYNFGNDLIEENKRLAASLESPSSPAYNIGGVELNFNNSQEPKPTPEKRLATNSQENRFDISKFSSKFLDVGLAQRHNFYVKFTPPGRLAAEFGEVALLCSATSLPGRRLATSEFKPYGYGQTIKTPYDVLYDEISFTFYIDASRASSLHLFDEWTRTTIQESSDFPKTPMRVAYRDEYICNDLKIYVVSPLVGSGEVQDSGTSGENDSVALIECHLIDAFPIEFEAIDLDWGDDSFIKLAVRFAFRTVEYRFGQFSPVRSLQSSFKYEPVQFESIRELIVPDNAPTTGFYFNKMNGKQNGGGVVQSIQQIQIFKTQLNNLFNARGVVQNTQALMPFIGNNRTAVDTINNLGTLITNTKFVKRNASSIFKFP